MKRLIKIKQCHSSNKWSTTNSIENDTHFDAHEGSALIVRNNDIHFGTFESSAGLKDVKSAAKHISTFNGLLNQLQDVGLQIFDDKMKAIFLPMTLPET